MDDLTKYDAYAEAKKEVEPINEQRKIKSTKILEHTGTIITASIIVLSMILFAYNQGFCSVYKIPIYAMSLDITSLLPIAVQLFGILLYLLLYVSSIITDNITHENRYNVIRVILGFAICLYIITQNRFLVSRGWIIILFALSVPALLELCLILFRKIKNRIGKNRKICQEEYMEKKREYILFSIVPHNAKLTIGIVAVFIAFSMLAGVLVATLKQEYQVFSNDDKTYVVIIDNNDKVLVQKATISDESLIIDTNNYYYFSKEGIEFSYVNFKKVEIKKHDDKQMISDILSTTNQRNASNDEI